jgi:hypothetical protein
MCVHIIRKACFTSPEVTLHEENTINFRADFNSMLTVSLVTKVETQTSAEIVI